MSVKGAVKLPYQQACLNEKTLFDEMKAGGQSKSLVYAFFAERAAQKVTQFISVFLSLRTV